MGITLTKTERLTLLNQYTILQEIGVLRAEVRGEASPTDSDWSRQIYILEHGIRSEYANMVEFLQDEIEEGVIEAVRDILDVYRNISDYRNSNPDDQELASVPLSAFSGFDGNHEMNYLVVTKFLIELEDRWPESKRTDGYNSHMPLAEFYARMVAKARELGFGNMNSRNPASREAILQVLAAGRASER